MLRANLVEHDGYAGADLDRALEALALLERTVNGRPFQHAVLTFPGFQFDVYEQLEDGGAQRIARPTRSNTEVLDTLLQGLRRNGDDTFMDLRLHLAPGHLRHVVGEEKDGLITTFREDFTQLTVGGRAGHYLHEWSHVLGFHHSHDHLTDPGRNCLSVPYALGNLMVYFTDGRVPFHCDYSYLNGEKR